MAKIIDFPIKRDSFYGCEVRFLFGTNEPLSFAHAKTKEMSEKIPAILFQLPHGAKKEVESLIREYEGLTIILLKRIMGLEKALFIEKGKK